MVATEAFLGMDRALQDSTGVFTFGSLRLSCEHMVKVILGHGAQEAVANLAYRVTFERTLAVPDRAENKLVDLIVHPDDALPGDNTRNILFEIKPCWPGSLTPSCLRNVRDDLTAVAGHDCAFAVTFFYAFSAPTRDGFPFAPRPAHLPFAEARDLYIKRLAGDVRPCFLGTEIELKTSETDGRLQLLAWRAGRWVRDLEAVVVRERRRKSPPPGM